MVRSASIARSRFPDNASVRASALCIRMEFGARSTARLNAAADSSKSLRCSWIMPSVKYAGAKCGFNSIV